MPEVTGLSAAEPGFEALMFEGEGGRFCTHFSGEESRGPVLPCSLCGLGLDLAFLLALPFHPLQNQRDKLSPAVFLVWNKCEIQR